MPSGPVPFTDDSNTLTPEEAFSGINQLVLQQEEILGQNIGQKMWDPDRATGLNALKSMIREQYSPQILYNKQNVKAVVYEVNDTIPSLLDNNLLRYKDTEQNYSLARVRVLSDARHFWIPIPKSPQDPVVGLYPYVRSEESVRVGDIVEVNFNDHNYQFSSVTDVGVVTKVVSRLYSTYTISEIQESRESLEKRKRKGKLTKGGRLARKLKDIRLTLPTPYDKGPNLMKNVQFINKVKEIAKRLKIPADTLIKVFEIECSMDPRNINSSSGAVGLIQFMSKTAMELKTTPEDILKMDAIKQLDLVEKYFNLARIKGRLNQVPLTRRGLDEVYLAVFYPVAIPKKDDFVLGSEKGPADVKLIAKQNSAYVNSNGVVTRGAILKRIRNKNYRYSLPR